MEKTWETFWTTGKVTDYLTYRNEVTDAAGSVGGHGHKDEGKTYLKNQYLVNKAIDTVTEKANVTFEDGSAAPDTSSSSADAE